MDNRIHRIHHSIEPRHFDKNFGVFTTLWDRLFGTAYFPQPDEWPATGILEADEPRTVREWLTLPWRLMATDATTCEDDDATALRPGSDSLPDAALVTFSSVSADAVSVEALPARLS